MFKPLSNAGHEKIALLTAAGLPSMEAHRLAGYREDESGSNALKILKRPEVIARIAELKGEAAEPVIPSAEQDAIVRELTELAFNKSTPASTRVRAFDILSELNSRAQTGEFWPGDKQFDLSRLTERQNQLCQAFVAQPPKESPLDAIMCRLAALNAKSENPLLPKEPASDKPAMRWREADRAISRPEPSSRSIAVNLAKVNQR